MLLQNFISLLCLIILITNYAFCGCGYFEGVLAHTTTLDSYLGRVGVIVTKKDNMVKTIWLKGCYITDKLILDRKNNLAFIM